jgi:hypothetical protein
MAAFDFVTFQRGYALGTLKGYPHNRGVNFSTSP